MFGSQEFGVFKGNIKAVLALSVTPAERSEIGDKIYFTRHQEGEALLTDPRLREAQKNGFWD
jgi:hypothetical protein